MYMKFLRESTVQRGLSILPNVLSRLPNKPSGLRRRLLEHAVGHAVEDIVKHSFEEDTDHAVEQDLK